MPREIFVDSSAWIAVTRRIDNHHYAAARILPRLLRKFGRLVTTNFVVAEVYVSLLRDMGHHEACDFLEYMRSSPRIERVVADAGLEIQAESILRRYDDQDFSYTDAVSFALMQSRGIKEAFAFDRHFRTMGFSVIPSGAN